MTTYYIFTLIPSLQYLYVNRFGDLVKKTTHLYWESSVYFSEALFDKSYLSAKIKTSFYQLLAKTEDMQ